MDDIRFSDGFDLPDRIAFGLTAWSLIAVTLAASLAYLVLRLPLPLPVTAALAVLIVAIGAALGWLRVAGRAVLEWAAFAVRFFLQARAGAFAEPIGDASGDAPGARVIPLEPRHLAAPVSVRRAPLATDAAPSRRPLAVGAKRIAVVSFEPGAGTTTVAAALACCLAAGARTKRRWHARRVALVDFHTQRPGVMRALGLAPQRGLLDLALANPEERALSSHLVAHCSGVRVLCGAPRGAPQVWPLTSALVREVFREADMEGFEVVLADAGCGAGDMGSACVAAADRTVVVCTATPSGLRDAYRCAGWIRHMGVTSRVDYVVNRMRRGVDLSQLEQDLGGRVLAEVPEEAHGEAIPTAWRRHSCTASDIAFRRLAADVRRGLEAPS